MTDAQTFRAPSTQAAFEMIQEALGPDAMIVSVRQLPSGAPWEAFQKRPEVEVLAIPGNTPPALSEPALRLPASRPSSKPASLPTGSAGKNGAELAAFLMKLASSDAKAELPKPLASISTHLIRQGVDAAIVKRVTAACKKALTPVILQDEARLRAFVRKYLEAYVHTARTDVISKDGSTYGRVICLVGSSGAGKTSTCAKLAALASRTLGKKVAWVSADTIRTGAIGLTQAFAEPLGIPLQFAYTPDELAQAVASQNDADLIVVDTPARIPSQEPEVVELGAFLTALPQRVTYLVAPAPFKESDLQAAINAFSSFDLKGLVITKLDETTTYGSALNVTWRSQLPIVYFTNGTRPLGDLSIAQANRLPELILAKATIESE